MKVSGRLPLTDITPSKSVKEIGTLPADQLAKIDRFYRDSIPAYSKIDAEFQKGLRRASTARMKANFPAKHLWNPEGRLLSCNERELLLGPESTVTYLKRVTTTDDYTGRVYHFCPSVCESSTKIQNSYVKFCDGDVHVFGRIRTIFDHHFARTTYTWCVIEAYGLPSLDSECSLFHVSSQVVDVKLLLLEKLSHPLVVAFETSHIWFLNSVQI